MVYTFTQPNFTSMDAATYKAALDTAFAALALSAGQFAPHAQSSPNMTVRVDAGVLLVSGAPVVVAAQNTGTITAPATNPRIDRVVMDPTTGAVSVVTGVEAVSPIAPPVPSELIPLCQVALATSTTVVTNSLITDERSLPSTPVPMPSPIINGAMNTWQRGTSFAAAADGAYTADRWVYNKVGAIVHTVQRTADAPTVAQCGRLLNYCLDLDVTTADSSIAATDICTISQKIEGFNFLPIAQRPFSVSFWVKGAKTGTHCVAFRNSGNDRSYVATFSIAAANTWEFKVVQVAASPSAGTWDYTTGVGLNISFPILAGSNFETTAGAWQTGNFVSVSGAANEGDNVANNYKIADVRINGFPMDDHQMTELRCRRYYQETAGGAGVCTATTAIGISMGLQTPMRANPTLALLDTSIDILAPGAFTSTASTVASSQLFPDGTIRLNVNGFTGLTAGNGHVVNNATKWLSLSAEL